MPPEFLSAGNKRVKTQVWSSENASVRHHVADGVAYFKVVGRLYAADVIALYSQGPKGQVPGDAQLVYTDWLDASVAPCACALVERPYEAARMIIGLLPGVMVVRERDEEFFKAYAWALAQQGIVRGVFTESWRAQAWLAARASLHAPPSRRTRPSARAWRTHDASDLRR